MATKEKPGVMFRVLEAKDENDILEPTPTPFEFQGKTYPIGPMPNRLRVKLASEFSAVLSLFESLGKANLQSFQEGGVAGIGAALSAMDVIAVMPQIITILLPNAVVIVSTCTGIPQEIVEDQMSLGKLAQGLRMVLAAEDFPLLMASFGLMVADFRLPGGGDQEAA